MNARRTALEVLRRVERDRAWIRPVLDAALAASNLERADRSFVTELCYGTVRWRARLDQAIGAHARRGLDSIEPGLLQILRLGAYQLLFTRVKPHAAVHETVDLARAYGGEPAARFVNAILRAIIRAGGPPPLPDPAEDPILHLAVRESFPRWLVDRLAAETGLDEATALLTGLNQVAPLTVRANRRRVTRDALAERLAADGVRATPTPHAPHGLHLEGMGEVATSPAFAEGLFTVQDEASQLVAEIAAPAPGAKVLDACAAPGGKATALAEALEDGLVDAVDVHAGKIALVAEGARRLGLSNLRTHTADATGTLSFAPEGGYDLVLLDAPCSGLGVLRRHPEAKWTLRPEDVPALRARQARLLANLARYVHPGGLLVYSVCTFLAEETLKVIEPFLEEHPEFMLVDRPAGPWQSLFDARGFFRVAPHRNGMDGFFAARLRKRGP